MVSLFSCCVVQVLSVVWAWPGSLSPVFLCTHLLHLSVFSLGSLLPFCWRACSMVRRVPLAYLFCYLLVFSWSYIFLVHRIVWRRCLTPQLATDLVQRVCSLFLFARYQLVGTACLVVSDIALLVLGLAAPYRIWTSGIFLRVPGTLYRCFRVLALSMCCSLKAIRIPVGRLFLSRWFPGTSQVLALLAPVLSPSAGRGYEVLLSLGSLGVFQGLANMSCKHRFHIGIVRMFINSNQFLMINRCSIIYYYY